MFFFLLLGDSKCFYLGVMLAERGNWIFVKNLSQFYNKRNVRLIEPVRFSCVLLSKSLLFISADCEHIVTPPNNYFYSLNVFHRVKETVTKLKIEINVEKEDDERRKPTIFFLFRSFHWEIFYVFSVNLTESNRLSIHMQYTHIL